MKKFSILLRDPKTIKDGFLIFVAGPPIPKVMYIIKQDIRISVPYSRPNSWTEWAEHFCGHSWALQLVFYESVFQEMN